MTSQLSLPRALRRHPFAMTTHFRHSLVLTWAFPPAALEQFCVPGLELDTYTDPGGEEHAFAAIALVDLDQLRPAAVPARFGLAQMMTGYRVFMRMKTDGGATMRGLRILASQATSPLSVWGANLTTRYHYQRAHAHMEETGRTLRAVVSAPHGEADVDVTAYLDERELPESSPFASAKDARRFAGPLPYTFSPDPEGIVVVKSSRNDWEPVPVRVEVARASFFTHGAFAGVPSRLANAFHVADLDYGWRAGQLHRR